MYICKECKQVSLFLENTIKTNKDNKLNKLIEVKKQKFRSRYINVFTQ